VEGFQEDEEGVHLLLKGVLGGCGDGATGIDRFLLLLLFLAVGTGGRGRREGTVLAAGAVCCAPAAAAARRWSSCVWVYNWVWVSCVGCPRRWCSSSSLLPPPAPAQTTLEEIVFFLTITNVCLLTYQELDALCLSHFSWHIRITSR